MKSLDILISLPITHINPTTLNRETLIDIGSVSIKSVHSGQNYDVEWMSNGTILILDAIESPSFNTPAELNSVSKMELNMERKRRSIESGHKNRYNHYLQKIIETDKSTSMDASPFNWNDMSLMVNQDDENIFDVNDRILADLPANRTIHFNCSGSELEFCLQGRFSVANFKANDSPILISLNFTIDLKNVEKIMTEKKDFLVVRTTIEVTKTSDETR